MGPVIAVEALPRRDLLLEINIVAIAQKLVELVFVGPVRALDLAVELWRAGLDVPMPHAKISNMPVEQRLELVAAVGHRFNSWAKGTGSPGSP